MSHTPPLEVAMTLTFMRQERAAAPALYPDALEQYIGSSLQCPRCGDRNRTETRPTGPRFDCCTCRTCGYVTILDLAVSGRGPDVLVLDRDTGQIRLSQTRHLGLELRARLRPLQPEAVQQEATQAFLAATVIRRPR
jgi:hypothetical protein